jgi:two-component system, cell cycle response regulator
MALNDLQQEQHQPAMRVVPLGFDAEFVDKLKKIFQRERLGQRTYTVIHPYTGGNVDVFLMNYDNPMVLAKKDLIIGKYAPNAHTVAASQTPLVGDSIRYPLHPYAVHGILLAAKILSVFDKIPRNSSTPVAVPITVAAPKSVDTSPVETANSYCVLVVDDSVSIQKSLELNLLKLPNINQIDFADSGEMALEKVEAKQYDIIFLDVMMPGIDGYETCTQIRKNPLYKKTPIVMVSAKCSPLDEVKGIIAGCTTYLTKPVQNEAFQKLSHRMMEWLANKKTT